MPDAAEPGRPPLTAFSDLVPLEWRDPAVYAEVIVEIYSSGAAYGSVAQALAESARALIRAIDSHPVTWNFIRFTAEQPVPSVSAFSLYSDGERHIEAHWGPEAVIPIGDYVVFASPLQRLNGGGTLQADATRALGAARGALMALAGHTAAEQLVFRAMPSIEKLDHLTQTAGLTENYASAEDFTYCTPESVAQLAARLATHIDPVRRRRFLTALTFIGRAGAEMDATVRFSHLWIAVEVAAGGYGKVEGMVSKLTKSEAVRGKLAEIKEARRQLFHEGRRYTLSQDQERLMCAAVVAQLFLWFGVVDAKLSEVIESLGATCETGLGLDFDSMIISPR